MKNITPFVFAVLLINVTSCEKNDNVPQKVKDTFAMKFPNATEVEWDEESDTEWEAEFDLDGKEYSSNFMNDGTWVETEYEVSESDIPKAVLDAMNTDFEGYEVEDIEFTETKDGKAYEFSIEKGEDELEVIIDAQGNILIKEKKQEDEDDGDEDTDND